VYLKGKQPFGYLIRVLLLLGLVWSSNVPTAMVIIFGYFALGSFARSLYGRIFPKAGAMALADQGATGSSVTGADA